MQAQYLRTILRDGIAATKTVKGFGRMRWSARRYASTFIENRRYWIKYRVLHIFTHQGVLWFLSEGVEKLLWLYVGYHTMTGELSIGEFSVVFFLARQFEGPMERMIKLIQSIRLQLVQAERVLQTLDVRPQISDAPDASTLPPLSGTVEFRNVGFEYVSGQPVLENINITIRPGERVAFVGDANNVWRSLAIGCAMLGIPSTLAVPDGYGPSGATLDRIAALGGECTVTDDPAAAAAGADVVYTDVWTSMGQEDEQAERLAAFGPFQVTPELMSLAADGAIFLHDLPAHRGEEVAAEVIDGPASRIWQQAENRMHAARGLLAFLAGTALHRAAPAGSAPHGAASAGAAP